MVINSRPIGGEEGEIIYRRRLCENGHRFSTHEKGKGLSEYMYLSGLSIKELSEKMLYISKLITEKLTVDSKGEQE